MIFLDITGEELYDYLIFINHFLVRYYEEFYDKKTNAIYKVKRNILE